MNPSLKNDLVQRSEKFRGKYRIESTRLKDWNYSCNGAYFVTICTRNREYFLGEIVDGKLTETQQSKICAACWLDLPNHYPNCVLDTFVIMPNHVHGIIFIQNRDDDLPVETIHELSLRQQDNRIQRRKMLIPKIIGRFKMRTAKLINQHQKTEGIPFWQKNYYDRIIRTEIELNHIREYIQNNPGQWDQDRNNVENIFI